LPSATRHARLPTRDRDGTTPIAGQPKIESTASSGIERQRKRGWTLQRIADKLNRGGIPTTRGGAEW